MPPRTVQVPGAWRPTEEANMGKRMPLPDRLFSGLVITSAPRTHDVLGRPLIGPCLVWTRAVDGGGYGLIKIERKTVKVHRVMYETFVGPVVDELDHLCVVRRCASPAHLEDVTDTENLHRALPWGYQVVKTHCPRGHAYDRTNTYHQKARPGRKCRACRRERRREAAAASS